MHTYVELFTNKYVWVFPYAKIAWKYFLFVVCYDDVPNKKEKK